MRALLLALLVLGVGGAGFYFWNRGRDSGLRPGASVGTATEAPETATIKLGDVRFVVSVAGEIGPAEQVSVRPEVNGRINKLAVDVGDRVKKGGLLFTLDDRDLRIEVEARQKDIESARLQVEKARLAMEQARRDFERNKELYDARLLSAQEYEASRQFYDSAIKDHELALNSIERSQKELALAQERLQKTRIEAPFDCTVLTRPVSEGQAVSGSGGFNSGTEVLTIADLSSMVINAHVNQADVTHLKQGVEVAVEVDAVPGLVIRGEVERIAPQATVKNNLKGYATRILLKDVDPRVQPGMTATISIPVATAQNVLVAPLAAVFSEMGERYVYVRRNGEFERQPVVVGVSDFFHAELKAGVSEGEEVALVQPLRFRDARDSDAARQMTSASSSRAPGTTVASGEVRPASSSTSGSKPAAASGTTGAQTTGTQGTQTAGTRSGT